MNSNDVTQLMTESLAEGLSGLRGRSVHVEKVVREPFRGSSSFATERLRVLAGGDWISVFFKDLNPFHQLVDARAIRETTLHRSRLELHVYKNILRGGLLGTPLLYGSRWEPAKGLLWMFLEDVGPKRLSRIGDFSLWVAAARWVARLHSAARALPGEILAPLPRHLAAQDELSCRRLLANLNRFPAENRARVRSALDLHQDIVGRLDGLPRGLIHNEFFGKNIIIRPEPTGESIAVIDWETAAIGLDYLDLISISTGRWTPEQRLQMWRAYFEQAEIESGKSLNWRAFCEDLHCVALHQCLRWLNWWSSGDDAHIRRWLGELDKVIANFGRTGSALMIAMPGCVTAREKAP